LIPRTADCGAASNGPYRGIDHHDVRGVIAAISNFDPQLYSEVRASYKEEG
jgi:hypothetical protein